MKQPQSLQCLYLIVKPLEKGRGVVARLTLGDRGVRKDGAESVQHPGPGCSSYPLGCAGSLMSVLPPTGDQTEAAEAEAKVHSASCPGAGPEEIKGRLQG